MNARRTFLFLLATVLCCGAVTSRAADTNNTSPNILSITNAIDAKTTFRIFRRRPDNNYWDKGHAYAYTNGVALLNALKTSKPWDGRQHAAAYGSLHAYQPALTITIDWSRTKKERDARSVTLCYGNHLFLYGDDLYQIQDGNYDLMNRLFPDNK
jgi:hypothetical protein